MAAEVERQNVRRTIDAEAVPASAALPLQDEEAIATLQVNQEKQETIRSESKPPAQNAERIT
jgi:hypothetical protein